MIISSLKRFLPLIDQAVVSGGNFLMGILLARALGADGYGLWALWQLGILFALGINQALVSTPMLTIFGKVDAQAQPAYLGSIAKIQILLALTCCVVAVVAFPFFFDQNTLSPVFFGLAVALVFINDFHRRRLFAQMAFGTVLALDSLLFGFQILGIGWMMFTNQMNLQMTWLIWMAGYVLHGVFGFGQQFFFPDFRLSKKNDLLSAPTPLYPHAKTSWDHWHDGKWLLATALLQWFAGNYFIAAAGVWIGTAAIGVVRMAQNLLGLAHILFLSLENTLPGQAAKSWRAGGQTALYQYLAKACSGGAVGMALFLVLISVGAEPVFQLLFGAVPPNTQWIVMGYAVVYALTFLAIPLRVALRTVGKSRAQFLAYVASMLFSVATAVPMLKAWGLTGLFAGLIGCQLIQLAVYGWDLMRDASANNEALERDKPL